MEFEELKEAGLNRGERATYIELLKCEEATASIISKRTNINRTQTYQILGSLLAKGLAGNVIKDNTRYYRAADPGKLLDVLQQKENVIQKLLPELMKINKRTEKPYKVELYEGPEGLKTVLNDVLLTKPKEIVDFTSGATTKVLLKPTMDNWHKKRHKFGIYGRFLMNQTPIGISRGMEITKMPSTEARFLPKGLETPAHIYAYGNKTAISLWMKESPFSILIENKEISVRFKEFFEWFWKIGTPAEQITGTKKKFDKKAKV